MSSPLDQQAILWNQRLWLSEGLYGGALDGYWGPKSEEANHAFEQESRRLRQEFGEFDSRTERTILTLATSAQKYARLTLRRINDAGIVARAISGTRTYPEQDQLYAQGRTAPGDIVTYARGGQSNHNFGLGWDIGIFRNGEYVRTDVRPYQEAAALCARWVGGSDPVVRWGGDWSRPDYPHYQLNLRQRAQVIAGYFEQGRMFDAMTA